MKIFAVAQGKGGVGKTTTTVGVGLYCARKGFRVLLIDADQQANLTGSFMSLDDAVSITNTYDLIQGKPVEPKNITENLDLLPSALELVSIDSDTDIDVYYSFGENIRTQFENRYDIVIIDTPGNLGNRVIAALVACDVAFSPSQPNKYSNDALEKLLSLLRKVRQRMNPNMTYAGVIMNAVKGIHADGTAAQLEERAAIDAMLQKSPGSLLGLIGQRAVIRDCFSEGKWLPNDEAGQKAAAEIAKVSDKLLQIAGLS